MSSRRRTSGFARRGALHQWTLHFGPNMTPMVDVVMVILVFFMASAAFVGSDWFLKAAVVQDGGGGGAAAAATPPAPVDPLVQKINVMLDVDGAGKTVATALDLQRAPVEALVERIKAMPKGTTTGKLEVIVRTVSAVPYRDVVKVHEACYGAGIEKVGLGAR